VRTLETVAPALAVAIVAGALMKTLAPPEALRRVFSRGYRSVILATVIGVPLPICSCSILPIVASLRRAGVPTYSILPFMLAAPAVSIPSIILSLTLLGPEFTAAYVCAVVIIALTIGALSRWLPAAAPAPVSAGVRHHHGHGCHACGFREAGVGRGRAFIHNLGELTREVLVRVVIGVLIASVLSLLPLERLAGYLSFPAGILAATAIAVPMYVCAVGSIPVVSALLSKGLCVGGGLVILILGPATNAASIMVLSKLFGRRFAAAYIAVLSALTLSIATALNLLTLTLLGQA